MLDVERGEHVDTRRAQFLNVLPAFGVAAAGSVGVGEFVDQRDLRMPCKHRVEIKFFQRMRAMHDFRARQDFERGGQPIGFGAPVGLDDPGNDIGAGAQQLRAFAQHFEGFADAGGGTKENLETAAALLLGGPEQRIGGGAGLVHCLYTARSVTPGLSRGPLRRTF